MMQGKTVTLKKKEHHRIAGGHLWVFSNEVAGVKGDPAAGDIVEIRANGGQLLGIGFYNPHSLIAARLLSTEREEISFDFFKGRISSALALRRKLFPSADTFRVVHGESDFLPGLIIDMYNDVISVQTLSAGMDARLTLICDVLESLLKPAGIIQRNESGLRDLEGLGKTSGVLRGNPGPRVVTEHGLRYTVDPAGGQKTGFYLDQRENRKAFRRYARGIDVLDCFCNDGGFSLNGAFAGARSVTGVDTSDDTVARARANTSLNKLEKGVTFTRGDAFEYLRQAVTEGKKFGAINLDPPAFAKNKKSVPTARRGYREINTAALRLLEPGGILATSSCSHHILESVFLEILERSARDAGRRIRILERRGAAQDHPVHPSMPETRYLKFVVVAAD